MSEVRSVVVLGGGLTGLTAAYQLQCAGVEDVMVVERLSTTGGLMRTNRSDGLTIDHLPHLFFTEDRGALRLFSEFVGGYTEHTSRLGIRWDDGFVDFPFQNNIHQLPLSQRREVLTSLLARSSPTGSARNLEEHARALLGDGILELFFRPYNEKLWLTPLAEMDFRWLKAKIALPDARELAVSILGGERERSLDVAPHTRFRYPRRGGIQALTDGLAERLGEHRIRSASRVRAIDTGRRQIETDRGRIGYHRLLSTLPINDTLAFAGLDGGVGAVKRLRANTVVCVQIVAKRVELPDYHWIYVPDPSLPYYRLTRVDRFNPQAAPGLSVLLAECALPASARVEKAAIAARVQRALVTEGVVRATDIERHFVFAYSPAYVVPHLGHEEDVDTLAATLAEVGIVTAGRFGEWRFFNMDHSIASATRAVEKVLRA